MRSEDTEAAPLEPVALPDDDTDDGAAASETQYGQLLSKMYCFLHCVFIAHARKL